MKPKKIALLGATGSIGLSTLDLIRKTPDDYHVSAMAAGSKVEQLGRLANEFKPALICIRDEKKYNELKKHLNYEDVEIQIGVKGIVSAATQPDADLVINGIVGFAGLQPTLEALKAGKTVGLANKESLVVGGELIQESLEKHKGRLIAIDSEHHAIAQCLEGKQAAEVRKIILTASGGPFRNLTQEELSKVTVEDALDHPTWDMGPKITIDSATLMNKGLEVIEAHWLFQTAFDSIDIVVHPQSIVHSMVEFVDGSLLAQLSTPDMRIPIGYALSYPQRLPNPTEALSLYEMANLEFYKPDMQKFPCLRLAYEAGRLGGSAPCVLNAANEAAVQRFLDKNCRFLDIPVFIEKCLGRYPAIDNPELFELMALDYEVRNYVLYM